jgi:Arc/MetJ family transcription regulator
MKERASHVYDNVYSRQERLNERASMRTNIDIDDALIDEVMKVANVKTKKEAVHLALQEFLKARKKKDLFDLAGKIAFEDSYDHKALRQTRYDAD